MCIGYIVKINNNSSISLQITLKYSLINTGYSQMLEQYNIHIKYI